MKHNCLIAAKSPVNKTHDNIIASYSKMQEAHLYAKFKGEIYEFKSLRHLVISTPSQIGT
jgi:hypothetical protein